jgi:HPt (histidine-containing phosphotransfer) domain-containing protein
MADVIGLFLEDLPVRLAGIKDAVISRNPQALREAAHALKGAAANLSLGMLFEASQVMERLGAQSRMDGADAAWRQLSVDATNALDVLHQHVTSSKEPDPCAS